MNRTQLANIFLDDRVRKILAKDKAVKNNGQLSLDLMAASPVPRNMAVDGVEFNDIHNMQVDMNTPKEVLLARKAELDFAQDMNGRSKLILDPIQGPWENKPLLMGNQGFPEIRRQYNPVGNPYKDLEALEIEKSIRARAGAPGQMNLPIDMPGEVPAHYQQRMLEDMIYRSGNKDLFLPHKNPPGYIGY